METITCKLDPIQTWFPHKDRVETRWRAYGTAHPVRPPDLHPFHPYSFFLFSSDGCPLRRRRGSPRRDGHLFQDLSRMRKRDLHVRKLTSPAQREGEAVKRKSRRSPPRTRSRRWKAFFGKNTVDQPLDEKRIESMTTQLRHDQVDTKYMGGENRPRWRANHRNCVLIRFVLKELLALLNPLSAEPSGRLFLPLHKTFHVFVGQWSHRAFGEMDSSRGGGVAARTRNSAGNQPNMS